MYAKSDGNLVVERVGESQVLPRATQKRLTKAFQSLR